MIQVMHDFFRITDTLSRPRLFATILNDTEHKFFFDVGLLNLERVLDAKIYGITTEKRAEVMVFPEKPTEFVIFYDPSVKVTDTPLNKQLRKFDPFETIFRQQFSNARDALAELGSCASDLIWRRALKDIEATSEPVYEEEEENQPDSYIAIAKAKSNILNVIRNSVFSMPNLNPTSKGFNVSPKFAKLVHILKACEPHGDAFRGIVFVQKRCVAFVLADILRTLDDQVGFLRPQTVVGHGASSDLAYQQEVVESFRLGTFNLLIATKFAEDLEIIPCTLVVRFDLFESYVSYAHCRARTRGPEGHLIHMAERGSDVHRRILTQIARLDPKMDGWIQRVANTAGSAVPPYALHETNDPYRSDSEDEDEDPAKFVKDPTTSGRIYRQDATTAVYRFVSLLQTDPSYISAESLFEFEEFRGGLGDKSTYICTVLLPPGAPFAKVSGPPSTSVAQARRSACYQTCVELFQKGLLDYRLFPRPPLPTSRRQRKPYVSTHVMEELSDKEDDELFLPTKAKPGQSKSTGTRSYVRKKPDFWPNSLPIMRGCLYPTIVTLTIGSETNADGPYAPIVILTRLPLPSIDPLKLYFSGAATAVNMVRGAPFEVDEDRLHILYRYTVRICRAVGNKPFICSKDTMAYFFAPLPHDWIAPSKIDKSEWWFPNIGDHIPWNLVKLAARDGLLSLNSQDAKTLKEDTEDAIIQDRWVEFTRRYQCVRVRPDLNPLSKPEDSPREQEYDSLVEYCKARRKGFDGLQNYKQPLIEVSRVPAVLNHLNPTARPFTNPKKHSAKYLIPELCAKFTIPASTFRTALLLPSILRRLDDILLVKELNSKFFDHSILEHELHAAISAPSSAVDVDYERLELLGDAYLKYLSSIYLFVTNPSEHEGALHVSRQRIISNRSLLRNADRSGLPQFIQSKPFTTKLWAPPNFEVYRLPRVVVRNDEIPKEEGEIVELNAHNDTAAPFGGVTHPDSKTELHGDAQLPLQPPVLNDGTSLQDKPSKASKKRSGGDDTVQWLGDKAVADVAEAIIGAAYVSGGREGALRVTKAINIPVPHIDRWSDFGHKALAPPPEVTAKLKDGSVQAVEAIIGHNFQRPHLLAQALTHASIYGNEMTCYERLEFIGDAILDFLVIRHIFGRDGNLSPGALTLLKGAMVSNSTLAAVCVWAGLHEHLLFESYALADSIRAYSDELGIKQREEEDLAAKESRLPGQYWLEVEPPKALSDVVESILGAVYVSDNFSPVGAEAFFDKVLKPFYDKHITLRTLSHHPTKILFELFQSQGCQEFEIVKDIVSEDDGQTTRCDASAVVVHDIILASAEDPSSTFAARRASFLALDALEGDSTFLTRTCDCRARTQKKKAERKSLKKGNQSPVEMEEMIVEGVLASDPEVDDNDRALPAEPLQENDIAD
ncbi:ribonuclease III [Rickenella mellea]|uniref:Ribonuclease III n=1 Tax=Rickenella mellea TaxID=50990 RepID=A0A4R5XG80_9AGAM|nr:ribonuclease III [Rickenella mellea]